MGNFFKSFLYQIQRNFWKLFINNIYKNSAFICFKESFCYAFFQKKQIDATKSLQYAYLHFKLHPLQWDRSQFISDQEPLIWNAIAALLHKIYWYIMSNCHNIMLLRIIFTLCQHFSICTCTGCKELDLPETYFWLT